MVSLGVAMAFWEWFWPPSMSKMGVTETTLESLGGDHLARGWIRLVWRWSNHSRGPWGWSDHPHKAKKKKKKMFKVWLLGSGS
jgi:hypothetical protein